MIVPRSEWTKGLHPCGGLAPAWTSGGTPRAALVLPVAMLMVHYAGSPDSSGRYLSQDPLGYVRGMYAWSFDAGERGDEYNYVVAGLEGLVYEWAGDHQAAHCSNWNAKSIGVQFGLDTNDVPPDCYADRLMALRLELVERGVLTAGHHVDQHGQHFGTNCPGEAVKARWHLYDRPLTQPEEDNMPAPDLVQITGSHGLFPTGAVFICDPYRQTYRWVTSPDELDLHRDTWDANGWTWRITPIDPDNLVQYGERIGEVP